MFFFLYDYCRILHLPLPLRLDLDLRLLGYCIDSILFEFMVVAGFGFEVVAGLVLAIFKGGRGVTHVALQLVRNHNHLLLAATLVTGSLYGADPGLLTFALVYSADRVYLAYDFAIEGNPFFRLRVFLLEHRKVQHLILYF